MLQASTGSCFAPVHCKKHRATNASAFKLLGCEFQVGLLWANVGLKESRRRLTDAIPMTRCPVALGATVCSRQGEFFLHRRLSWFSLRCLSPMMTRRFARRFVECFSRAASESSPQETV